MDLMPGIMDLSRPNYKDSEIYGKIKIDNYVVGALTINSLVTATINTVNYVEGAVHVEGVNNE